MKISSQQMKKVLHISNTEILSDSRILKEIIAVAGMDDTAVSAIGVWGENYSDIYDLDGSQYTRLIMRSRSLYFMPRAVRYFFEMIEFTVKVIFRSRLIRPDLVHCHDTFALPAGWILKKLYGCKIFYDAHELESSKNGQNFILSYITLLIERFCWSQIDLLVTVSEAIIEWYMVNLGKKSSILILNSPLVSKNEDKNSVILSEGDHRYFHHLYSIPTDNLIFVYLGILGAGRGIEICLEAFASGPENAHVVFMGYGDLSAKVQDFSSRYSNIHYHPPVAHDKVVSLVSSADYGLCLIENVSLSDYYCLPNKLFEYCFAGLPILASNFPEMTRLVREFSLGVCCDPSADGVQLALKSIVTNRPVFSPKDFSELSWDAQALRLSNAYRIHLFGDLDVGYRV